MELRTLRYFLAAADEGNITHAAEILHITQPSLSRQLMDLERELGTTLLIRGKRALTLTDDGMLFRQRAQEIVELANKAEREFIEKTDTISGVISLGATEAVGARLLARLIHQFMEKYPQVQVDFYSEMADQIRDKIDKGLIDIGLLLEPVDTSKYEFMRLSSKETWGILVRRDHPLAGKEQVYVQDILEYPLFLPKRENVRKEILNWIGVEEHQLNVKLNYNLLSNVALLVEEGAGCAVCLDGAIAIRACPDNVFKPLLPERTTRSVLMWKKDHMFNPATSLFVQMINMFRNDPS